MDDNAILALVTARAANVHQRNDMDPPSTFPAPVSAAALAKVERELGFSLPPLLRRVYTEIGDGWFGPGCGLQGAVSGHFHDDEDKRASLADVYHINHKDEWPDGLVPLVHWGCAIFSCVDCASPSFPMIRIHFGHYDRTTKRAPLRLVPEGITFRDWLAGWAEGKDVEYKGAIPED
jgi:SMI1 / KNR4 family (SUKH-1)